MVMAKGAPEGAPFLFIRVRVMNPLADAPELAVVLGGGLDAVGAPLASTRARAHRAAQLARERPELALICSGDRQPRAPARLGPSDFGPNGPVAGRSPGPS